MWNDFSTNPFGCVAPPHKPAAYDVVQEVVPDAAFKALPDQAAPETEAPVPCLAGLEAPLLEAHHPPEQDEELHQDTTFGVGASVPEPAEAGNRAPTQMAITKVLSNLDSRLAIMDRVAEKMEEDHRRNQQVKAI
ncbi:unnamed protein product [Protopolystoma xenopodis]|uniref:Uncharacterized protein n=1 Tax=Protopolystoma xenopodis TaxID=117903 RepID=A0A3S5BTH0_9PLAT|nr:unnamed protein product [Protopolystoma xenopodis]